MEAVQEKVPMIFRSISKVMEEIGAVKKDKVNTQQGFKFRSIDDVYNALHPALTKNKVFIVPDILERNEEVSETRNGARMRRVICRIKFTFYAEDGSSISHVLVGEGMDTGDKATNKAMAIAYKYACFQVFCIPTEEMLDPDSENPEMINGNQPKQKKTGSEPKKEEKKTVPEIQNKKDNPDLEKITPDMLTVIQKELGRTGVKKETIEKLFKVKQLEDMTVHDFTKVMRKFKATPDKETVNE